jgi:two-component system, OmpR family, phosphate regulon response regulator PhoB
MSIRALVVEDEKNLVALLRKYLEREGFEVQEALDGPAAIEAAGLMEPDVVVLDWMLPGLDGIEVLRELRRSSEAYIIMLTARTEEVDRIVGLSTGADDYLTKPFSPRELLARIKAVLRRRAPQMTDDPVDASGLRLEPGTRRVFGHDKILALGPTEFRLLHFLMTHAERVHSRAQLLDQVWGDHVFVEERTVDVHIRRLRQALEPSGHDRLVETVRGSGYRFSTKPVTVQQQ